MATRTRLCTQISEKLAQYQWDIQYVLQRKILLSLSLGIPSEAFAITVRRSKARRDTTYKKKRKFMAKMQPWKTKGKYNRIYT